MKLCECGCGLPTTIATSTDYRTGKRIKGKPCRYLSGHGQGTHKPREYLEEDRGYDTPCWIWQKGLNRKGYGLYANNGVGHGRLAHRVVYLRTREIPEGLELDHLCRVRACVNPDHLELVTHKENVRRGYAVVQGPGAPGPGSELREKRLAAKLSQADLAALIGVSQGSICHWERGLHPIPDDVLPVLERQGVQ